MAGWGHCGGLSALEALTSGQRCLGGEDGLGSPFHPQAGCPRPSLFSVGRLLLPQLCSPALLLLPEDRAPKTSQSGERAPVHPRWCSLQELD